MAVPKVKKPKRRNPFTKASVYTVESPGKEGIQEIHLGPSKDIDFVLRGLKQMRNSGYYRNYDLKMHARPDSIARRKR